MLKLGNASALDRMTANEQRQFWRYGMGRDEAPSHDRIHSAFEGWARDTPLAVAVEHGDAKLTYAELDRQANCLASLLRAHHVSAGDRVGIFLHRSVPMVVGILATLKLGAAYVPQDARITPTEHLGHIMSTAGIRVVLTLAQHVDRIRTGPGQIAIPLDTLALDALKYDGSIPLVSSPSAGGPTAVVIFTSGTTGRPNGVAVTHANLCNVPLTEAGSLGIQPGMRVAQLLNIGFDMAVWEIFGALSYGGTLVIGGPANHNVRSVAAGRPTRDGLFVEQGALRGLVTADH